MFRIALPALALRLIVCLTTGSLIALSARATASAALPARLNAEHVVREWAAAARALEAPSQSANRRVLHTHRSQLNGHQAALVCEFRGPVDADDLLARYRLTAARGNGGTIRLMAVPRDRVEQLFVSRWEVALDARTKLPVSIRFDDDEQPAADRSIALLTKWQRAELSRKPQTAAQSTAARVRLASGADRPPALVRVAGIERMKGIASAPARMPSLPSLAGLTGLPWKAVRTHLIQSGYQVLLHVDQAAQPQRAGLVLGQFPGKGVPLRPGTTIILVIPAQPAQ